MTFSAGDLRQLQHRTLCPSLALLLVFPASGWAQQQPPPRTPAQAAQPSQAVPMAPLPATQSLRVIALAGNGERNDLQRGVMAPLVVQVLDSNGKPVEGADVVFRFPLTGPSASFPNQQNSQKTATNADGQAAATGWVANRQVGKFNVKVNASHRNEIGEVTITMSNVTDGAALEKNARKGPFSNRWVKIGIIAGVGGAIAAAVLLTRGGSSSSSTVTITPGAPTIGGSR